MFVFTETDQQGTIGLSPSAVYSRRSVQLDGVAHFRARPVGLQVVHFRRSDPGPLQCFGDYTGLGRFAGHRQSCARPVLVECGPQDHAPDSVAVGLRIAEPLQDHDPRSPRL